MVVGCGGDDAEVLPDSSFVRDSGQRDGGGPDAGPGDDAGPAEDAGASDVGPEDSGRSDGGLDGGGGDVGLDGGGGDVGLDGGGADVGLDGGSEDQGPADQGPGVGMDGGPIDVDPGDADPGDAVADAGPPDTGPPDVGPLDTGPLDAGPLDAGPPDTGPSDTGPPDTGPPDTGPIDAGGPPVPAYMIDGDLSDWTAVTSSLANPGFGGMGLFGPDNRFESLQVYGDANFFYLGYRIRSSGNSAIVHFDTVPGGATSASAFPAWPRLVEFARGIDHFVAQFEGQPVQLRDVLGPSSTPDSAATYFSATVSTGVARTTEIAIPWSALGLGAGGPRTVTVHAGIYGGDNFGAGDIAPNQGSTPAATGNTIDTGMSFRVVFANGWTVTLP